MSQGMDLYFKRHDGQAVTCEDFFAAMRDANDADFANFLLWYGSVISSFELLCLSGNFDAYAFETLRYSLAGTPIVKVTSAYNADAHTFSLKFRYANCKF